MTEELYYESAYLKEFDAVVTNCDKTADNKYEIILDRTAFFPEQGGQSCDGGTIEFETDGEKKTADVSYVSIDSDKVIKHVVNCEIPVESRVHGVIDWKHRFSNMQQHTGEHIFSGIVNSSFGYDNVGFHLSDSEVTMDYNGVITREQIADIERKVNQAIWENVAVRADFPTDSELQQISYRSKKELSGQVRIVTVEGYDVCACCAPHVERTGEIGILKVISLQNYKGGVRVNILCGSRALEYIQKEHDIVSEISGMLTTSSDKIMSSINRLNEENTALKANLSEVREKLIEYEIAEIDPSLEDVILVKEDMDGNSVRKMVNSLCASHGGVCGIFSGNRNDGYRFVMASGNNGKALNPYIDMLKEKFKAKGGGSPKMVQGSLFTDDIKSVLDSLNTING